MKRACFGIGGILLVVACEGSSQLAPTSPTFAPPAAPAPAPASPAFSLTGVVRAGGSPVPGATVALLIDDRVTASVVTDTSGAYHLPSVRDVDVAGALVSVIKAEYFTVTKYIPISRDTTQDFELERASYIQLGDVVTSPVGESLCASWGYGGAGGSLCRRFALTVPASGTLEVSVASAPVFPFDVAVLRPDGSIGAYDSSSRSPVRASLAVAAGQTYQIDVVHASAAARQFDLATSMR